MPYKDKVKRYEAIRKSVAKKPELYKALGLNNQRKRCRKGYLVQWRYGISIEEYNKMIVDQNNACAICFKPAGKTKSGRSSLHVDHNHTTKKVRGLLCPRCNTFVGYLDKPEDQYLLYKTKEYLEKNS